MFLKLSPTLWINTDSIEYIDSDLLSELRDAIDKPWIVHLRSGEQFNITEEAFGQILTFTEANNSILDPGELLPVNPAPQHINQPWCNYVAGQDVLCTCAYHPSPIGRIEGDLYAWNCVKCLTYNTQSIPSFQDVSYCSACDEAHLVQNRQSIADMPEENWGISEEIIKQMNDSIHDPTQQ